MTEQNATLKEETINLKGNIIAAASRDLRSNMQQLIDTGVQVIILDMSQVQIVDSTGVGVIIGIHNILDTKGGGLRIINIPDEIMKMFKIMHLDRRIPMTS